MVAIATIATHDLWPEALGRPDGGVPAVAQPEVPAVEAGLPELHAQRGDQVPGPAGRDEVGVGAYLAVGLLGGGQQISLVAQHLGLAADERLGPGCRRAV